MKLVALVCAGVLATQSAGAGVAVIMSVPGGASVSVNGKEVGRTPMQMSLPAGVYDIAVWGRDYETHEERVAVKDKLVRHVVRLRPKKYPVDVIPRNLEETGWAIYDGNRLVMVDGKLVVAPATIYLPRGVNKIRLMKDGYCDVGATVTVERAEDDKHAVVEIDVTPRRGYSSYQRCLLALIVGTWVEVGYETRAYTYRADGTMVCGKTDNSSARAAPFVIEVKDGVVHVICSLDWLAYKNHDQYFTGCGDTMAGRRPLVRLNQH